MDSAAYGRKRDVVGIIIGSGFDEIRIDGAAGLDIDRTVIVRYAGQGDAIDLSQVDSACRCDVDRGCLDSRLDLHVTAGCDDKIGGHNLLCAVCD